MINWFDFNGERSRVGGKVELLNTQAMLLKQRVTDWTQQQWFLAIIQHGDPEQEGQMVKIFIFINNN